MSQGKRNKHTDPTKSELSVMKPNKFILFIFQENFLQICNTMPKKTKGKSQKVAICKRRMPINFNKLSARMSLTTKCYVGQMLEVCLETTETKTPRVRAGRRLPRSQPCVSDLVQRTVEPPLKRYHMSLYLYKKRKSITGT